MRGTLVFVRLWDSLTKRQTVALETRCFFATTVRLRPASRSCPKHRICALYDVGAMGFSGAIAGDPLSDSHVVK